MSNTANGWKPVEKCLNSDGLSASDQEHAAAEAIESALADDEGVVMVILKGHMKVYKARFDKPNSAANQMMVEQLTDSVGDFINEHL